MQVAKSTSGRDAISGRKATEEASEEEMTEEEQEREAERLYRLMERLEKSGAVKVVRNS